jgi:hypothetical protein
MATEVLRSALSLRCRPSHAKLPPQRVSRKTVAGRPRKKIVPPAVGVGVGLGFGGWGWAFRSRVELSGRF